MLVVLVVLVGGICGYTILRVAVFKQWHSLLTGSREERLRWQFTWAPRWTVALSLKHYTIIDNNLIQRLVTSEWSKSKQLVDIHASFFSNLRSGRPKDQRPMLCSPAYVLWYKVLKPKIGPLASVPTRLACSLCSISARNGMIGPLPT